MIKEKVYIVVEREFGDLEGYVLLIKKKSIALGTLVLDSMKD